MTSEQTEIFELLNSGIVSKIERGLIAAKQAGIELKEEIRLLENFTLANFYWEIRKWKQHYSQPNSEPLTYERILAICMQDLTGLKMPFTEKRRYGISVAAFNYYTCFADAWFDYGIEEFPIWRSLEDIFHQFERLKQLFIQQHFEHTWYKPRCLDLIRQDFCSTKQIKAGISKERLAEIEMHIENMFAGKGAFCINCKEKYHKKNGDCKQRYRSNGYQREMFLSRIYRPDQLKDGSDFYGKFAVGESFCQYSNKEVSESTDPYAYMVLDTRAVYKDYMEKLFQRKLLFAREDMISCPAYFDLQSGVPVLKHRYSHMFSLLTFIYEVPTIEQSLLHDLEDIIEQELNR